MRRHRSAATLFPLVLLLAMAEPRGLNGQPPGGADPLGRRLKVSLFRYAGAEDDQSRTHFSRFKAILRDKITVLVEELEGSSPGFSYLENLSLQPGGNDGIPDTLSSEAAVQTYWAGSRSLLLLRGSMVPETKGYSAQTRLFFGDLQGALPHPSLSLNLPLDQEQFANTTDSHSLAIYYALAMDAARLGDQPAHVITLLSRAQDKLRDLAKRGPLSPAALEIQQAVTKAIATQKGRIHQP